MKKRAIALLFVVLLLGVWLPQGLLGAGFAEEGGENTTGMEITSEIASAVQSATPNLSEPSASEENDSGTPEPLPVQDIVPTYDPAVTATPTPYDTPTSIETPIVIDIPTPSDTLNETETPTPHDTPNPIEAPTAPETLAPSDTPPPDGVISISHSMLDNTQLGVFEVSSPISIITSFDNLDSEIAYQEYEAGTIVSSDELLLPSTIFAKDQNGDPITINEVIWRSTPEFDPELPNIYEFCPLVPESFSLADDVDLPVICIFIRADDLMLMSAMGIDITGDFTDPNFLNAVRAIGGKSETDPIFDVDVENVTYLNVNNKAISSLAGLEHFINLTELHCESNQLTHLPSLPNGLEKLFCSLNALTGLPDLPGTLTWLDGGINPFTSLPTLPAGLTRLTCVSEQLTSLPELPASLTFLLCTRCGLTSLPSLPAGLRELTCWENQLTFLPELPSSLIELHCHGNQLTSLPALPAGLENLTCGDNALASLPTLPVTLKALQCEGNQLTTLPSLPDGLMLLRCERNSLTSIPNLPSALTNFWCNNNQLTTLPTLPLGLTEFLCSNNQLVSLSPLSDGLIAFICDNNRLTSLPLLPDSITILSCASNQLTSIDVSGLSLSELDCSFNYMDDESAVIGFNGAWNDKNFIFAPQYAIGTDNISLSQSSITNISYGGGGSNSIVVTSSDTWTAKANQDWISLSQISGSSGNSVTVTYCENNGPARIGTVTFTCGTKTAIYTINQDGCTIGLSQATWTDIAASGTNKTFSVTGVHAGWIAVASENWISLYASNGNSGNNIFGSYGNNLRVTVAENKGASSRTGTVTLTAKTGVTAMLTVTQCGIADSPSLSKYTITYNANSGSGAPAAQVKEYGKALTLSTTIPTRTGYSFLGWNTNASASLAQYPSGGSYTIDDNALLFAVWSPNKYTITYSANGGSGAPTAQVKEYGKALTLSTTIPARTGYSFVGWSPNAGAPLAQYLSGGSYTIDDNALLFAVWSPNKYTITYNANGGSGAPTAQVKEHGKDLALSTAIPTRTGYSFIGWNTNSGATVCQYASGELYKADANATLHAIWQIVQNNYTVSFNANGGSNAPSAQTAVIGASITVPSQKPTREGYTFKYWNADASKLVAIYYPSTPYTFTASTTLYAFWSLNSPVPYFVSNNSNLATIVPGNVATIAWPSVASNAQYKITVTNTSTQKVVKEETISGTRYTLSGLSEGTYAIALYTYLNGTYSGTIVSSSGGNTLSLTVGYSFSSLSAQERATQYQAEQTKIVDDLLYKIASKKDLNGYSLMGYELSEIYNKDANGNITNINCQWLLSQKLMLTLGVKYTDTKIGNLTTQASKCTKDPDYTYNGYYITVNGNANSDNANKVFSFSDFINKDNSVDVNKFRAAIGNPDDETIVLLYIYNSTHKEFIDHISSDGYMYYVGNQNVTKAYTGGKTTVGIDDGGKKQDLSLFTTTCTSIADYVKNKSKAYVTAVVTLKKAK